jgi:HEAT repeat protein
MNRKSQAAEAKVAHLNALREDPSSAAAATELKKALLDRSNYVVARAAQMIGECHVSTLAAEMRAAYDRFLVDPVKNDPQCMAKTALAEALVKLEHDDRDFYLRGMQYQQFQPAWGGAHDCAANLRGICAFGLVQSNWADHVEVLNALAALIADPEKPARIDAVRAIAQVGRREGIPLLRVKIHTGDKDVDIIGECFSALLSLSARESIPFIATFLESGGPDLRLEAAAALGESREPEAFKALKGCWEKNYDPAFKRSLLISMGLSRQAAAQDFLLSLIHDPDLETATAALEGLAPCRFQETVCQQAASAVRESPHASLNLVLKKLFKNTPL